MKQKLLLICFVCLAMNLMAQQYNNEWIDYTKTYYKFTIGSTGLYRINQAALPADIASAPVQNFQLWRNGKQVAIYTSVSSGSLPSNGYLEFWGERNDGVADKALYRDALFQVNDRISLQTDTAAFFLTINTNATQNLRLVETSNNVNSNTLPAEPYFMYSQRFDFRDQINRGLGVDYGTVRVTSSSYDRGEWFGTNDITVSNPYTFTTGNLYPYTATAPASSISMVASGVSYYTRLVSLELNNNAVISQQNLSSQDVQLFSSNIAIGALGNSTNSFRIKIDTIASLPNNTSNRISVSYVEVRYPRLFNFSGNSSFMFQLPANANGNYIEIPVANFSGGSNPVLYDLTNNKRYTAAVNSGLLKFRLEASITDRNLLLVNTDLSNTKAVINFATKVFTNYLQASNQGNYLIISNKLLGLSTGSQVDLYRQYRASAAGGSFNAKIIDIDELVDQFAFGIKKHPISIKNFVRFAKANFAVAPTHVFLLGKGITYDEYRRNESNANADLLNLVPTFGWPASDVLMVSPSIDPAPTVMVGRLAALSATEVANYLEKIKEYESQQANAPNTIAGRAWMKNAVNVAGSNDGALTPLLKYYLDGYKVKLEDTLMGYKTENFNTIDKGLTTPAVEEEMKNQFNSGIGLLTYFGHSAATQLDYKLDDPFAYSNQAKYPFFLLNGCNAGNFFDFDVSRFNNITSFSEKFVFAKQRGAIAVLASTHYGVTGYLDNYSNGFFNSLKSAAGFRNYVGKNMMDGIANVGLFSTDSRMHAEQFLLHGDPAIKIAPSDKTDFDVEASSISITPNNLTVADSKFNLKTTVFNLGKAWAARVPNGGDSLHLIIKWQHGNGTTDYLFKGFIKPSIRYKDSVVLDVPIVAARDNGNNCITVIVDSLNQYDEVTKTNNTYTNCFFITDNDLKPVYPYNFSIINKSTSKLYASTANPLAASKQYTMEMDTTELFNSPFKIVKTVTTTGGVVEFDPQITYKDSTVYYWRVVPVGSTKWNVASFVYLNGTEVGFNQSHVFQYFKNVYERITLDSNTRRFNFNLGQTSFKITQGVYPYKTEDADFSVLKNGARIASSGCMANALRFNVFDPVSMRPWYNQAIPSVDSAGASGGYLGSNVNTCSKQGRQFNFEFDQGSLQGRNKARDFLNAIPNGYIITIRCNIDFPFDPNPVATWKTDATANGGISNTLYGKLSSMGFVDIDSFNTPKAWVLIMQKGNTTFAPKWDFGYDITDVALLDATVASTDTLGYITTPALGPSSNWKLLRWRGTSLEANSADAPTISIIGVSATGVETTLATNITLTQQDYNLSAISATQYPYLKLKLTNEDRKNLTPYQLRYWRLIGDAVPEGALAANIKYAFKDTLEIGEPQSFAIAFKNVSEVSFTDSLPVKIQVTDRNAVTTTFAVPKFKKPLAPGDTATVVTTIDTKALVGTNTFFVEVNPNSVIPEQYHFNNFMYKSFYVNTDNIKPVIDVTFDGTHILSGDYVSAKPSIRIKLKDESRFLALTDTSGITISLLYPDNTLRRFRYNTDTLRFIPSSLNNNDNSAYADFNPSLLQDGTYTLYVSAKDMTGNKAGSQDYNVSFQVNNKPMISDLFNYPNPFTTSTAFVFTLTGSQIPSNIRIQILTVTGKVVKEINKDELGPIRIGKNITTYKWDGTDTYGQKLANGVYLYRVITDLNGNSLEKLSFKELTGNKPASDKWFKGGYGKMYLMR